MKYFIDEEEVSEQTYREKLLGNIVCEIINNKEKYLKMDEYDKFQPHEKGLAINYVARKEFDTQIESDKVVLNSSFTQIKNDNK